MKAEDLLTPGEVAKVFKVDPKTVTRWAATGKLPCIRTPGGHRRFRVADVRHLLDNASEPLALRAPPDPDPKDSRAPAPRRPASNRLSTERIGDPRTSYPSS